MGRGVAGMVSGRRLAVVFPGQGSQSFDMLAGYGAHRRVADTLREASDIAGCDYVGMIESRDDALHQTTNTQPVMLAMGVGVYRASGLAGGDAVVAFAGHSLGEYAALVCAGSLGFGDAVKLVRRRGELMQNAGGAMAAAVGIGGEDADKLCAKLREDNIMVWAANFNTPQQTVIAGEDKHLANAEESFKQAGAKRFVRLRMSCASHCPLMKDAAAALAEELDNLTITMPSAPVIHNLSAAAAQSPGEIRELLRRHLTEPVDWTGGIGVIAKDADVIAECGPGKVLVQMNKRIAADIQHLPLASSDDLSNLAGLS